ncbi:MAG: SDR family oxidoreductase [Hyphomicrobiaceae bacterium]
MGGSSARKVALVTGGNRGIGRGIALELAAAGYDLLLTARDGDALRDAAADAERLGAAVELRAADLTEPATAGSLVKAVTDRFGRLDVLIENAGGAKRGHLLELADSDWINAFALKFFAHVRLAREAWPLLRESGGSVVAISGIGARAPVADYAIGSSVCGAQIAFMKALADLGKHEGVQVNVVNPGTVETDRFRHRLDLVRRKTGLDEATAREHHRREIGVVRFGLPEDVAALVAFIVSPRGRWIHGSAIDIDGGQLEPLRMAHYD